ncbi:hypothetical protein [Sphingomonas oligoaromativorans]|jgi:hypothetical protein|nr:hypothetical protein [Sphingomonas oligoaromativorans]NIJ33408.1 hypothetical protein [Sphingomonas oligoaromativorans]
METRNLFDDLPPRRRPSMLEDAGICLIGLVGLGVIFTLAMMAALLGS